MKRAAQTDALPWVCLNGKMVPAKTARVSVFDRSFQLGDGLFETLRIINGWPVQWRDHWQRFTGTARLLGFKLPITARSFLELLPQLLLRNRVSCAILRFHLSRGVGPRGYSPASAKSPVWLASLYPAPVVIPGQPQPVRVGLSPFRWGGTTLEGCKTASRAWQVLAKRAADLQGCDDVVFLDHQDNVFEATSSNFFWLRGRELITPPLSSGILPGTTRQAILKLAPELGLRVREQTSPLRKVLRSHGAFLSVCTRGISEVVELAGDRLPQSELVPRLHARLEAVWQAEARRRRGQFGGSRPRNEAP
jgi:branched-chain amino acid aminotransferase